MCPGWSLHYPALWGTALRWGFEHLLAELRSTVQGTDTFPIQELQFKRTHQCYTKPSQFLMLRQLGLSPVPSAVPLCKRPVHFSYTASLPLLPGRFSLQAVRRQSIISLPSRYRQHLWLDRHPALQMFHPSVTVWHVQPLPSLNIFLQVNWICQEHCFKFPSVDGLKQTFLPVSSACPPSFEPRAERLW